MEDMKYTGDGMFSIDLRQVEMFLLTPERVRSIAQRRQVMSGPGTDLRYMPTQNELDIVSDMLHYAINRGQMIQFGHWPNDLIKKSSGHGGKMYMQGALAHPFNTPYVLIHSWNDETFPIPDHLKGPKVSVYLVNPFPDGKETFIDFEAMELEGFKVIGDECIGICDRIVFHAALSTEVPCCEVIPFALRFPDIKETKTFKTLLGTGATIL